MRGLSRSKDRAGQEHDELYRENKTDTSTQNKRKKPESRACVAGSRPPLPKFVGMARGLCHTSYVLCLSIRYSGRIQVTSGGPEAIRRPVRNCLIDPYKSPLSRYHSLAPNYGCDSAVARGRPTVTSLPDGDQGSLHVLLRQQRNRNDILLWLKYNSPSHLCWIQDNKDVHAHASWERMRIMAAFESARCRADGSRLCRYGVQLHSICSDTVATYLSEIFVGMENEMDEWGGMPQACF
jgi:hypothetical protein